MWHSKHDPSTLTSVFIINKLREKLLIVILKTWWHSGRKSFFSRQSWPCWKHHLKQHLWLKPVRFETIWNCLHQTRSYHLILLSSGSLHKDILTWTAYSGPIKNKQLEGPVTLRLVWVKIPQVAYKERPIEVRTGTWTWGAWHGTLEGKMM